MKNRIGLMLIVGLLMTSCLFAQDTAKVIVPKAVSNKMIGIFPQTQLDPVTWSKEGANYKGAFVIMDKPAFAIFDEKGQVIRIERRLHYTYLPKKIVSNLNEQYPGNVIEDVYETTDAAGGKTYKTTFKYKKTINFKEDGLEVK